MRQILIAVGIALTVSILLTPVLIRLFTRQGFGHEIREDGPPSHHKKRGTPSMGGVAILAGIWAGYLGTHLVGLALDGEGPVRVGPAGARAGHRARRRRLRRRPDQDPPLAQPRAEQDRQDVGMLTAAVLFGVLALQFRNADGLTPGSAELSYVREIATVTLAPAMFVLFCVAHRQRLVERGELHRRAGRAGRGCDGDGERGLRAHHLLAVPQRVRDAARGSAATTCVTRSTSP